MIEETGITSEFEEALREEFAAHDIMVGDVIEGTIAAIHGDVALVDVSGKSEAVLAREELDALGTGDPVEVVVVAVGDEIRVSRRLALERRLTEKLATAVESGEPLEGKVVGRRKGGFDVTISGVRGFCPISHIEEGRSDDLDRHLGKTYSFRVLEYRPDDDKLVVSRAAHLRQEREQRRREAWQRLEVGAELDGTVRALTNFGAFVDIGGVDGLVHITEIAHRRIGHPRDALAVGEQVRVKVLELDREKERISLSIKQLLANPWDEAAQRFPARGRFAGTVVRKAEFGAFVELAAGIDGLLHVSQLPPGMGLDALEVGQAVTGWVRELDLSHQRIGLTLRPVPERDPWDRIEMRYQEGQVVEGRVENGTDFGVFVELEPGLSALIPASELGLARDQAPQSAYPPGASVTAKVLSVDGSRQRISLSVRAYQRDQERQEYSGHMERGGERPALTGFGARLAQALGKKKA